VHRELRWYWHNHEFPRLTLGATAALERENAAVLARHLSDLRPEVVLWWAMGGMSLSLIEQVRWAGLPAVGLVGDEWISYGPDVDQWMRRWRGRWRPAARLGQRRWGVPTRLDLDRAATWLFNTHHLLEGARRSGWKLPGAGILPPGVDAARFAPRESLPWRWRLLYCGRLDPRKGVATAIEALARLPREAKLSVHGDGDAGYRDRLRQSAQRLGLADRVHFASSDHSAVPDVYASADAVLFPVLWREPWGLVPLEAMAVGRPVIASRSGGGPAEYLLDGANCLQFEPGDAAGLAAAVQRLAADAELRRRVVEGGHRTASRYSAAAFHEGIEEAISAVVRR
jgi:glycosyltransferase involved in cell wall biosynthesis